jgi:hypothetical protein
VKLATIGGKLLRTAAGALATACRCCVPPPPPKYWCFPAGLDPCGNPLYECRQDETGEGAHSGPFESCEGACPPPQPCEFPYWCFTNGTDPCGNPTYECRQDETGEGAHSGPFESCEGACPTPPPCQYYCCYDSEPSLDPNAPLPSKSCQQGPCSSPSLTAGGPFATAAACEEQCVPPPCSGPCPCPPGCECVTEWYLHQATCEYIALPPFDPPECNDLIGNGINLAISGLYNVGGEVGPFETYEEARSAALATGYVSWESLYGGENPDSTDAPWVAPDDEPGLCVPPQHGLSMSNDGRPQFQGCTWVGELSMTLPPPLIWAFTKSRCDSSNPLP